MKKFYFITFTVFFLTISSFSQERGTVVINDTLTVDTKLVYSEDFNADLTNWVVEKDATVKGTVKILNGKIDINVSGGCTIWNKYQMNGPTLIEYDAIVVDAGGTYDRVSDLNCYWMATDLENPTDFFKNSALRGSSSSDLRLYYVGLGGYTNTKTRFRRYKGGGDNPLLPEHDFSDPQYLITANAVNHIKLVAYNNIVQYYRNDQLIIDFYDAEPYTSGYFAFRTTNNHMNADNFRIYSLSPINTANNVNFAYSNKIFPSIATSVLNVLTLNDGTCKVFSSVGTLVYQAEIQSGANTIAVENLSAGIYFIRIETNSNKGQYFETQKFIKK